MPSVPEGERLDFGGRAFREYERAGAAEAGAAAFVLVAGGLGERLGYSGIKLALPADLASGVCFLQASHCMRCLHVWVYVCGGCSFRNYLRPDVPCRITYDSLTAVLGPLTIAA